MPYNQWSLAGGVSPWIQGDCDSRCAGDTQPWWEAENEWRVRAVAIPAHVMYLECHWASAHGLLQGWEISTMTPQADSWSHTFKRWGRVKRRPKVLFSKMRRRLFILREWMKGRCLGEKKTNPFHQALVALKTIPLIKAHAQKLKNILRTQIWDMQPNTLRNRRPQIKYYVTFFWMVQLCDCFLPGLWGHRLSHIFSEGPIFVFPHDEDTNYTLPRLIFEIFPLKKLKWFVSQTYQVSSDAIRPHII